MEDQDPLRESDFWTAQNQKERVEDEARREGRSYTNHLKDQQQRQQQRFEQDRQRWLKKAPAFTTKEREEIELAIEKKHQRQHESDIYNNVTYLMRAIRNGYLERAIRLVANDDYINAKSRTGVTALMLVAEHISSMGVYSRENILTSSYYEKKLIKKLLRNGADVLAEDNNGKTALMRAEEQYSKASNELKKAKTHGWSSGEKMTDYFIKKRYRGIVNLLKKAEKEACKLPVKQKPVSSEVDSIESSTEPEPPTGSMLERIHAERAKRDARRKSHGSEHDR